MSSVQRPLGTNLDDPETRPWFLWDEDLSVRELRGILAAEGHPRWVELAAKVMRETRDDQVWMFLPLERVVARYRDIAPRLGRRRAFWDYLLQAWRRHGFIHRLPEGLLAAVSLDELRAFRARLLQALERLSFPG